MPFDKWKIDLARTLEIRLSELLPEHCFKEVITYSVLPTGKLFRPLLVYSLAHDLGGVNKNHTHLAHSIELHHTYSLVHDDLPEMDDDDMRRGRPSAHKKFSNWQAILSGDALINLSYEVLSDICPEKIPLILKEFSQSNGPSGLILGQVMDLAQENKSIQSILKLHELKTGRLIQLCLVGSAILSHRADLTNTLRDLGRYIGVSFQLLDDLCELTESLSTHEEDVNPFIHFDAHKLLDIMEKNTLSIQSICKKQGLQTLSKYLHLYNQRVKSKLQSNLDHVRKYINLDRAILDKLL